MSATKYQRPNQHRWSLRFKDRSVEADFLRFKYERYVTPTIGSVMLLNVVCIALWGFADALVVPERLELALWLRFGVAFPGALLGWLLTRPAWVSRAHLLGVCFCFGGPAALFLWVGAVASPPGDVLYSSFVALYVIAGPVALTLSGRQALLPCFGVCFGFALVESIEPSGDAARNHMILLYLLCVGWGVYLAQKTERHIRRAYVDRNEVLFERGRSEELLRAILPAPIVARLKDEPGVIADRCEDASVLFADLVGFTELSTQVSAERLVEMLNELVSEFDALASGLKLEKIKTIGDAYMLAAGVPEPLADHARVTVRFGLAIQGVVARYNERHGQTLSLRVGVNSGSVVAGVIGKNKFCYDLWGDCVNTASRMESHGLPGEVQVSEATAAMLGQSFIMRRREGLEVKGKGLMTTYLVGGERPPDPGL